MQLIIILEINGYCIKLFSYVYYYRYNSESEDSC